MTGGHVAPGSTLGVKCFRSGEVSVEFGYPPSLSACRGELCGDRNERGDDVGPLQPHAGIAAGQQQGGRRLAEKVSARIGARVPRCRRGRRRCRT